MYKWVPLDYQCLGGIVFKKSLKIPKRSVNLRRTDNTMAKRKVQKDKQRSTKHTHKTKDRVTRIPLKTWGEFRCFVSVSSSCSTRGTRAIQLCYCTNGLTFQTVKNQSALKIKKMRFLFEIKTCNNI